MSVECPRCKQPLYVSVTSTQVFEVKELGVHDVSIGEPVEAKLSYVMKCMNCKFTGWLDEYYNELSGVSKLFDKEGKIICTCSARQKS